MITKSCWAFILVLVLIPLCSGSAFAQLFSSEIERNAKSWVQSSTDEVRVAQAVPESGDPVADHGGSLVPDFESRFAKGQYEFGFSLGYAFTINIPPVDSDSDERTRIRFAHLSPNFKYNLTGLMGKSVYRGALYWVIEVQLATTVEDPTRNGVVVDDSPNYLFGFVPAQLEYKFLNPNRSWAPFLFAGIGGSWSEWFQESKEISTAFEFILQGGAGIEYFFDNGTSLNFNYRLWHLSNSNVKSPNVGLNAHVFSLGYSF
ncbi:MAG: acyloxyacyl hydrolase [Nitrospinota bacterium]|nr:acyloxyacyl hydrolase [Nitrospinota bacterium]